MPTTTIILDFVIAVVVGAIIGFRMNLRRERSFRAGARHKDPAMREAVVMIIEECEANGTFMRMRVLAAVFGALAGIGVMALAFKMFAGIDVNDAYRPQG
jgi:hypothetical protein